ncbi:MAG: PAS domain S-box protein [Mariprofundales bacterium]
MIAYDWRFFRCFLLLAAGGMVLVTAFVTLIYQQHCEIKHVELTVAEHHHAEIYGRSIGSYLQSLSYTIVYIQNQVPEHRPFSDEVGKASLEADFVSFLETSRLFEQVRLLDAQGREFLRAERAADGSVQAVSGDDLQDKSDRDYVQQGLKLRVGQLYLSPVDWNQEHGQVVEPRVATLRIVVPVMEDGQRVGLLVLNMRADELFSALIHADPHDGSQLVLVNPQGKLLYGATNGGMLQQTLSQRFPDLDAVTLVQMRQQGAGELYRSGSSYTFLQLHPLAAPQGLVQPLQVVESSQIRWMLVIAYPKALFAANNASFVRLLWWILALIVPLILLACGYGACLIRQRNHVREVVRQQNEALRRQAEELRRFADAVEHAGQAITITDADTVIQYVNAAFTEITGYSSEEVIGHKPSMLSSGQHDADFYHAMWLDLRQHGAWQGEIRNRRKDGKVYPERLYIRAVKDDADLVVGYIAVFSDISEEKLQQEMVRHASKLGSLGTMVGGIAHNFNNMLAALSGQLYMAGVDRVAEDRQGHLQAAEKEVDRAGRMVRQLMGYANKGFRFEDGWLELIPLVDNAVRLAAHGLPQQLFLRTQLANLELEVFGNAHDLQQAVVALIDNAADALGGAEAAAATITVILCEQEADAALLASNPQLRDKRLVSLMVSDQGKGIDAQNLERIFDPFFTTRCPLGTGLGLSSAQGAVHSSGGVIEVCSQPGAGATFTIWWPVRKLLSAVPPVVEAEKGVVCSRVPHQVLLVEDEEALRKTLSQVLESLGYRVLDAADGEEALAIFLRFPDQIRLVLSDVVLPRMNGLMLRQRILEQRPEVPVVMMTGYSLGELHERYEILNGVSAIEKPVDIPALSQRMHDLIAASSQAPSGE